MNSFNPINEKRERNNEKQSVEKNYAPNRVPNQGTTQTAKLYQARQKKRNEVQQQIKLSKENNIQLIPKVSTIVGENREFAKAGYQKRIEQRIQKYETYSPVPINYSPYLNFSFMTYLTLEERMEGYNKNHKCPHKRRYTVADTVESTLKGGWKRPAYIKPSCNCKNEIITKEIVHMNCRLCTNVQLKIIKKTGCSGYYCDRCKSTTYKFGATTTGLVNRLDVTDRKSVV